jgi:geranylgeranyl pyrophosphate synthase
MLYALSLNSTQSAAIMSAQTIVSKIGAKMVCLRQEEKVPSLPEQMSLEQLGFVEIRAVTEEAPAQTYDLEVEETHSYIANGIVVHNTLMQDDVEDDSIARRGKPCTHKIFGIDTAVNTGTIMFYWPLIAITENWFKLDEKTRIKIYELYSTELLRVCSGQAWDIAWHHGGFTPNEKQYLNMCLSKTGVLTKFACQLGAIAGGATKEQYGALGDFGQIVGVGFQIQDDILELTEKDFKAGKGSIGGDIHEGKRTLIIIRTLKKANAADKKRLVEILDSHTTDEKVIQEALDIIGRYDGIDYSKEKANELVTNAWLKLDKVLPKSNAKEMLKKFAEYLVDRKM